MSKLKFLEILSEDDVRELMIAQQGVRVAKQHLANVKENILSKLKEPGRYLLGDYVLTYRIAMKKRFALSLVEARVIFGEKHLRWVKHSQSIELKVEYAK